MPSSIKLSAALFLGVVFTYPYSLPAQTLAQPNAVAPLPSELGPHSASPPLALYDRTRNPLSDRLSPADRKLSDLKWQGNNKNVIDPGLIDIGRSHDLSLRIIDYMDDRGALPVEHSTAIVVATLLASQGFVGEEHTSVYSEHEFQVEQVLKSDDPALVPGGHIVGTRMGGTVRFPSGHLRDYIIEGQGVPKIGARYLLFLWRASDNRKLSYGMDTAYEIGAGGKVYALDFVQPYTRYEGANEADVLAAIKQGGGGH